MRRFLLAVVVSTLLSPASPQSAIELHSSAHPVYRNRAYGYEVKLPPGLTFTRTSPPNPDHGIGIVAPDGRKLWVDASYTDASSTGEEADNLSKGCEVKQRDPATLGGESGIALRFYCAGNAYGEAYSEFLVLVVHSEGDRSAADYQIGVRANGDADSLAQIAVVRKLAAGFSFVK